MNKPRIFIGSSSEGLRVARALEEKLVEHTEPVLWENDMASPSSTIIESLEKTLDSVEFAILVITPDDVREKRGSVARVPRDNVVFELGLFMGKLGRSRAFAVADVGVKELPTDWLGMTLVKYDPKRSDDNMLAAVSTAASKILRAIKGKPRKQTAKDINNYQNALLDMDQFLYAITSWPRSSRAVAVSDDDTAWVWKLFPSLLCWRLSGTPILVETKPVSGSAKKIRQEKARRRLLRNLGVQLKEMQSIEKKAFYRQAEYPSDSCVIICNENPENYIPFATRLDGTIHSHAVRALMEGVGWPEVDRVNGTFAPKIVNYESLELIAALQKGVDQYSSPDVSMEIKTVKTADLYLMTPFVRKYKYKQIGLLSQEYKRARVSLFDSVAVELKDEQYSIITPPVVEKHDVGLVVMEGATRATFCRDSGITEFRCVVVSGVRQQLPGIPVPIGQVIHTERSLTPRERMDGFDYNRFRAIERAVHPY